MKFPPRIWKPIAGVLSLLNVGGLWFAARAGEPWHATTHAVLAILFGLWALPVKFSSLFRSTQSSAIDPGTAARLDALEYEVGILRQELGEAQERLDFTERILSQQRADRLDPPL